MYNLTAIGIGQLVVAVLVTLGILLQTPKATGLGGTIGGGDQGGGGYRRRRGIELSMLRASAILVGVFAVISALMVYFTTHNS